MSVQVCIPCMRPIFLAFEFCMMFLSNCCVFVSLLTFCYYYLKIDSVFIIIYLDQMIFSFSNLYKRNILKVALPISCEMDFKQLCTWISKESRNKLIVLFISLIKLLKIVDFLLVCS